jgi:hypothetical protein
MGEQSGGSSSGPAGGGSGGTGPGQPAEPPAPTPASRAEIEAVENELLGRVVDAPEAGGVSPLAPKPGPSTVGGGPYLPTALAPDPPAPSVRALPSDADAVAFAQLVDLANDSYPVPEPGESPSPPMGTLLRGVIALGVFFGCTVALVLIIMVLTGWSPGGSAPGSGTGGEPARAGATSSGGDPGGGAAGGSEVDPSAQGAAAASSAAQPAGGAVLPTSCFVPEPGTLSVELTDVSWVEEDGVSASWEVVVHNRGDEAFGVFLHETGEANAATRANNWEPPATDWNVTGFYIVDPDATAPVVNSWSGGVSQSVEQGLPTLCSWQRTDRIVAVYHRPECTIALYEQLKAAPDAAARDALMAPYAVDMPVPDQMTSFSCAE